MKKHLLAALSLTLILAACSDDKAKPAEQASSVPAAESAAPGVDPVCEAYFTRVEACLSKVSAEMAVPFKQGVDQTRAAMQGSTAAQQAEACKLADEQFTQSAQMLKCE